MLNRSTFSSMRRALASTAAWCLIFAVAIAFGLMFPASPALAQGVADTFDPLAFGGALFLMGTIGRFSDMVVYQAEFQTGMVESVTQFLAAFNEGSRGAIRLTPRALKGHYNREAFFKDVAGLVSRRDITSTAPAAILRMEQDEVIGVKCNRKVGPVANTLDSFKKAGLSVEQASVVFGRLAGTRKMRDMLNTAIAAVSAAIESNGTATTYDATSDSPTTATPLALQRTLAKFGDSSQDIVAWVAHSKPHFDVLGQLITDKVTGLADIVTIQGAIPAYNGKPSIVTDSPALRDEVSSETTNYNTLGLVRDAVIVEESEDETFYTDIEGGAENLYRIFQSEHAYNVTVRGHKWNTVAGINPSDAAVATPANWIRVAHDTKLTAGVRLVSR